MLTKTAAFALCVALTGLPALAQTDASPPVLESLPAEQDGATPVRPRAEANRDERAERRGPGEQQRPGWMRDDRDGPPHGMRGGRTPEAGFRIRLGEGVDLEVRCGETAFAECMESARPLLEQLER